MAHGCRAAIVRGSCQLRNSRPQSLQPLDQPTVAALDRLQRTNFALALGCQRRGNQRHSRSEIAAIELTAAEAPGTRHDDPMWIAEEKVRAHAAQLLEGEETQLVHPVVH